MLVRSPKADRLAGLLAAEGGKATDPPPGNGQQAPGEPGDATGPSAAAALRVTGLAAPRIGEIAAANRIVLHELTPRLASLEEAYMELTADSSEYGHMGGDAVAQPPERRAGHGRRGEPAQASTGQERQ